MRLLQGASLLTGKGEAVEGLGQGEKKGRVWQALGSYCSLRRAPGRLLTSMCSCYSGLPLPLLVHRTVAESIEDCSVHSKKSGWRLRLHSATREGPEQLTAALGKLATVQGRMWASVKSKGYDLVCHGGRTASLQLCFIWTILSRQSIFHWLMVLKFAKLQ